MATAPDQTKPVEKAADAVVETATVAPKAAAAVVEAAPLAAAAVIETAAAVVPKAKRAITKVKHARKPKPAAKVAATRVAKPVKDAAKTVKSTIQTIAAKAAPSTKGKTMTDTVKNMTANVSAQGEKLVAELKTRTEDAVAKGKAMFGDVNDFNKGNIEALVESGKIAAKGLEKLGQDQADYVRRSFEHTTTSFKGMASVKSPTELLKLHSDYVRSSFDMFVAEASRSTEASLKLAGEIAQPISNRFAVAAEKVKLAA